MLVTGASGMGVLVGVGVTVGWSVGRGVGVSGTAVGVSGAVVGATGAVACTTTSVIGAIGGVTLMPSSVLLHAASTIRIKIIKTTISFFIKKGSWENSQRKKANNRSLTVFVDSFL
jgi:hypothetical protein